MQIEKNENRMIFGNLGIGEVFEYDGLLYMRTDTIYPDEDDCINCVRLSDASFHWFDPIETEVTHHPDAKVVI